MSDGDVPLFYLSKASEKDIPPEEEVVLGETTPSLVMGVPSMAWQLVVAVILTVLLFTFQEAVVYVARSLGSMLGMSSFNSWFSLIFCAIWLTTIGRLTWLFCIIRTTRYKFTNQRLYYSRGVLNKKSDQIELMRIRDLSVDEPFWLRLAGVGNVILDTVDRTHPIMVIRGQQEPQQLKDWLHDLNLRQRKARGYREFESTG